MKISRCGDIWVAVLALACEGVRGEDIWMTVLAFAVENIRLWGYLCGGFSFGG